MQRRGWRLSPRGGSRASPVLRLASTGANTKPLVEQMNWEEKGLMALLTAPGRAGTVSRLARLLTGIPLRGKSFLGDFCFPQGHGAALC